MSPPTTVALYAAQKAAKRATADATSGARPPSAWVQHRTRKGGSFCERSSAHAKSLEPPSSLPQLGEGLSPCRSSDDGLPGSGSIHRNALKVPSVVPWASCSSVAVRQAGQVSACMALSSTSMLRVLGFSSTPIPSVLPRRLWMSSSSASLAFVMCPTFPSKPWLGFALGRAVWAPSRRLV